MTKKYAKIYETENAIIRIITPEQELGRPMTQEEIDEVLEDVRRANEDILIGMHKRGTLKKYIEEKKNNNV